MYSFIASIVAQISLALFSAGSSQTTIQHAFGSGHFNICVVTGQDSGRQWKSLLSDKDFQGGINLRGNNSSAPQKGTYIYPSMSRSELSVWQLAEWGSRVRLNPSDYRKKNGARVFENKAKLVSFKRTKSGTEVEMDVTAFEEYDCPRKEKEGWVHLLIEQDFGTKPQINDIDSLVLLFDGRLTKSISRMANAFDPRLHTAQFQLFVVVQNINKLSSGYRDFLWFGVPFYDFRHRIIERYAAQDLGKEDATGKFIFSLGTRDFSDQSFHDGKWTKVRVDLKPYIVEAITTAKSRGYLKHSGLGDFALTGMNMGWEVPGIFDVGFEFREFDLQYKLSKE